MERGISKSVEPVRTEKLYRRSVHLINHYLEPRDIYKLITSKSWNYASDVEERALRDQAMMSTVYCSAGRITEIVGGPAFKLGDEIYQVGKCAGARRAKVVGRHLGLRMENINFTPQYIRVTGMKVVKHSQKLIDKYGEKILVRDDFIIPLQRGLFTNIFWDQLVPFGVLIKKYLDTYQPKGKLFGYASAMAYKVIRYVTGYHPHWFRAQAEQFYGYFLLQDTIKLAKFVNVSDPTHLKSYIGYSCTSQMKDPSVSMDFNWIDEVLKEKVES